MKRTVFCVKLKKEAEGLDQLPYPGALGEKIYQQISKEAWRLWLRHQTLLINENRLNMTDPNSRRFLMEEMEKYFFKEGSQLPSGYKEPN